MGGGGKGMKLARSSREVKEAVESAQREAEASFGDSRVLLERFIEIPRHIEVQVWHFVNDEDPHNDSRCKDASTLPVNLIASSL